MKLDNIRLLVTNFDECFHFYKEILSFEVTWGEPGGAYASFETAYGDTIAIFNREAMAAAVGKSSLPKDANVQDRFAIIFRIEDLAETVDVLKSKGAIVSEIHDQSSWGIKTAHVRDPEGNLLELMTSMPEEEWDESLREESEKYD
ncbi:VOC family protein [Alteribacter populi]|uniref:VOC family protein n=1 Tax=Alteribacter populi TaxID=2011011 RepID=UPI000BBAB294|nr:VOC family protein [Alteribacter populi]